MTMASNPTTLKPQIDTLFLRKRLLAFGLPALILAYFAYIFVAFDMAGLSERANLDNGKTLIRDSYSYKTHVTRDNRNAAVSIAIEGSAKAPTRTAKPLLGWRWVRKR